MIGPPPAEAVPAGREAATKPTYAYRGWEADFSRRELHIDGRMVPIGGRAFEILEILLQAGGRLVSKTDLIAHVWPGVFVEENTLQVHIRAIRKALGPDQGLLRSVWGRGYILAGEWVARRATAPRLSDEALPPPVLPPSDSGALPLTPARLIGRAGALQQLGDYLSAYRLVTLVGPGGIGKTRLALEVARSLMQKYHGDVRFVDLAALSDPRLAASAVASALKLELPPGDASPASIATAIGARAVLVLLDNCEHLLEPSTEIVDAVIRQCPHASILATSREMLRTEGEFCFRVPPLEAPPETVQLGKELLRHSAALFLVSRIEELRGGSPVTEAEVPVIGAICRRLDGIPLALEFAASRVASLGAEAVLTGLHERFSLLTGGRRTALPKHRTLRATLDWSHDLLSEAERALLRSFSVFPAGFTLEAAMAVTDGALGDAAAVMVGISNLVAKSMISLDSGASDTRWRLLETTRAYALEQLVAAGEAETAKRRHAVYYRNMIAAEPAANPTPEDLLRHGRELENIRAALNWAFSPGGDVATGVELTTAYVPVWLQLLLVVECTDSIQRALTHLTTEYGLGDDVAAWLHIKLGFALLNTAGLVDSTAAALRTGLRLAERLDDPALRLRALWATWSLHLNAGRYEEAHDAASRLLRIAEGAHNPADVAVGHRLLGTALHFMGRQPEARELLERALDHQHAAADQAQSMWFLVDQRIVTQAMLARVLLLQGELEDALRLALRNLAEAQRANDRLSICYALRNALCPVALAIDDLGHAEAAVALLSDLSLRNGMAFWTSWTQCLQGQLEVRRGDHARAIPLLRSGIGTRRQAGWLMRNPEFMGSLAEALARTGQVAEALELVREAAAVAEAGRQRWCLPELHRIEGDLLLSQGERSEAERRFDLALATAGEQGALLCELGAALALARLRLTEGRGAQGEATLRPVYARFGSGLDRPLLRQAREVLAECRALAAPGRVNARTAE